MTPLGVLQTVYVLALLFIVAKDLHRHPPRLTAAGRVVLACFGVGILLLVVGLWLALGKRTNAALLPTRSVTLLLEPLPFIGMCLI